MAQSSSDHSNNSTHNRVPNIMTSTDPIIDNLNAEQLEGLFIHTLSECNRLSKSTEVISREVAMAKMVNYCIRMLHSTSWHPRTVVRTMVHIEAAAASGSERRVQGMMYQAMREKRDEGRVRKAAREAAAGIDNFIDQDESGANIGADKIVGAEHKSVDNDSDTGHGRAVVDDTALVQKTHTPLTEEKTAGTNGDLKEPADSCAVDNAADTAKAKQENDGENPVQGSKV